MGAAASRQPEAPPLVQLDAKQRAALSSLTSRVVTRCDDPPAPPPLPPAEGGASTPPPPPPASGEPDSIAQAAQAATSYTNPGPFEMASMDAKRLVMLDTFDGFRCDINKQVSPFMAAVHSFWLGTSMIPDGRKSQYTFVTQVADEQGGLLMARVDPSQQSVDGRIHRPLLGGIALGKLQVTVSPSGQNDQLLGEIDFGGFTWTGNLKYGSMAGGIVYGCNYFQSITSRLAIGGEGMYLAANQSLLGNYTLKYTMPAKTGDELALPATPKKPAAPGMPPIESEGSSTLCINYNTGQQAATLNYKRVVTPNRVTLGSELSFSPMTLDSNLLLGAEFKLNRSKISLCVDGTLRIKSLLEAKLGMTPGSPTLSFSADMDHFAQEMKFGYGINVEG